MLRLQTIKFDNLTLFSLAWAVANVLHFLTFSDRVVLERPFSWLVVLAAALVILRPQGIWPFMLMLCFSVANTLDWMPFTPNHITFEFIINAGMIGALVWAIARFYQRGGSTAMLETPAVRENLLETFAPITRVSLLILYFYAVLHKLNWDYFNVDISCSTFLLQGYSERLPFLPDTMLARWLAVWGTLIIEATIPLFLAFKRTRWAGIFLGLAFHFFLSVHPHPGLYSFSGLLFALYMLFTPTTFANDIQHALEAKVKNGQQWASRLRLIFALMVVLMVLSVLTIGRFKPGVSYYLNYVGLGIWFGWGALLMVLFSLGLTSSGRGAVRYPAIFSVRPIALWVIPIVVLFNGMNPYLGLKTQTSFSMFSNLRTEGGISNHLFIPSSLLVKTLQSDLIEILETDLKELKEFTSNNQLITYFELRRTISEANMVNSNFYVNYIRADERHTVTVANNISSDTVLTTPHSWMATKFVRFRPIDKGPCLCKH